MCCVCAFCVVCECKCVNVSVCESACVCLKRGVDVICEKGCG